jgi:hypothetical protein
VLIVMFIDFNYQRQVGSRLLLWNPLNRVIKSFTKRTGWAGRRRS